MIPHIAAAAAGCLCDCNADGAPDILDFICFRGAFAGGVSVSGRRRVPAGARTTIERGGRSVGCAECPEVGPAAKHRTARERTP